MSSESETLRRMAASDEYSATEVAIFDGAAAELEALRKLLREAEGPVTHHAAEGCKMCIAFLPELRAALYPKPQA